VVSATFLALVLDDGNVVWDTDELDKFFYQFLARTEFGGEFSAGDSLHGRRTLEIEDIGQIVGRGLLGLNIHLIFLHL
jgi:hypothetical protein